MSVIYDDHLHRLQYNRDTPLGMELLLGFRLWNRRVLVKLGSTLRICQGQVIPVSNRGRDSNRAVLYLEGVGRPVGVLTKKARGCK